MSARDTAIEWSELEPLLDELLDLPVDARDRQLLAWQREHPQRVARLRELLQAEQAANAVGFLNTLPPVTLAGADGASAHLSGDEVGPWRLLTLLGQGGMAEVWLAQRRDGQLDREVALKLPLPGYAQGRLGARFQRERDILAGLVHPHIARLYDAGVHEQGQPWLALEYVRGQNVLEWCERHALNVDARLALFLQVCEAVQYAHGRLVIHRDIKPANVLVDGDGQVHLLDFGIARLLDGDNIGEASELTVAGGPPLTLEYASPEQIEGERPGIASDVYALGVLLYRLLCGHGPYEPAQVSRQALIQAVLSQQIRRPSERAGEPSLRRRLRGDLDTIVLKALDKTSSRRYATVDSLAADISRYRQGEPVLARPASMGYRLSRFVARHRLSTALSALAITGLIATTGMALHQAHMARREVARTQALNQFVLGLFNPDNKPIPDTRYRDMPAHELVAKGAERVITSLPDQPLARFQLMHDLAALTTSLGMADTAERLYDARLAQSAALMGKSSPEYADALLDHTSSLEGQGRYPDAYRDAQQALAIYQAHGETDPDRLARAHYQIGAFGSHSHASGDAGDLAHLQKAADLWRNRYDKDSDFDSVMARLSQFYLLENRTEDAYRAAREGMEHNRRQFGEIQWETAASEEKTGLMLGYLLRPAEAEPLLRQALSTQQTIWGDQHFLVARSRTYLGNLLAASVHHDEARALLRAARDTIRAPAWQGNKVVLAGLIDQSNIDLDEKWGAQDDALAACMPYYAKLPALQAPIHVRIALACSHVAMQAGRKDDAERMLGEAEHTITANWPNDHGRMAPLWRRRGEAMLAAGDRAAATRAFSLAIQIADKDDLDTVSAAWQGLTEASTTPLDASQRSAVAQLLARLEIPEVRDYYALYAKRLRDSLGLSQR